MAVDVNLGILLLNNFIAPLLINQFLSIFLGKRKSPLSMLVATFLLYHTAASTVFLLFNIPIVTVVVNLVCYFAISLNYEVSLKKRIFGVISSYFILILAESIAVIFLVIEDLSILDGVSEIPTSVYIFISISNYLLIILLSRFKNIKTTYFNSSMTWLIGLTIPVFSFIFLYLFATQFPQHLAIISSLLLFIINIIIYYYQNILAIAYRDKLQSALDSQEKEYYFAQNKLMTETVETVKSIRHDMKLHLATLQNYTTDNPEAIGYINSLIGELEENNVYSDTGNIAIDSIINFKLKSAKEDEIGVSLDLFVPAVIDIETSDIVIILGNLLDNALDAVDKVVDKFINIHISYQIGNLLIRVENTFNGAVKVDKKRGELVTSKDGNGHGYGLKNIHKSAEKYNRLVEVTYDDDLFVVEVLLYGKQG